MNSYLDIYINNITHTYIYIYIYIYIYTKLYIYVNYYALIKLEKGMERDNFMSPCEAKKFGLIDDILEHPPSPTEQA